MHLGTYLGLARLVVLPSDKTSSMLNWRMASTSLLFTGTCLQPLDISLK